MLGSPSTRRQAGLAAAGTLLEDPHRRLYAPVQAEATLWLRPPGLRRVSDGAGLALLCLSWHGSRRGLRYSLLSTAPAPSAKLRPAVCPPTLRS
ncbi:hypothetical protein NDU88_002051 [Pleurodeles waltl]|uniref:Uncharacterized protein n=1 Tax=Pleurodeles waltl TaxID=8319 RepID=A0AAV7MLH9_PLEWA|nr:hypothetical protein NDU88_002051 [Pleurodeles waltl]